MQTIEYSDFQKVDIRVGTVVKVETFPKTRIPAYKVLVDLGELGIKKSSAQLTHYLPADLIGKQVICICNFKPKQIADFMSEILITGFDNGTGQVVLASVEKAVPNGAKLF